METSLIIAIISGGIAVTSVVLNFLISRRLENLKYKFQEQLSEKNARRDYEYEARKKLYAEYEPIFFKFSELSEGALSRIKSLIRSTKDGKIGIETGWLSKDEYYLRSTIYLLFAPLASYRLMREKINLVDLRLDTSITMQYLLAKLINRILSSDYEFASFQPLIDYVAGNTTMKSNQGKENPKKFWRQGVSIGELDQFIEVFIKEENGKKKIIDFGEFNDNVDIENSTTQKRYNLINYIFLNFRPDTRPVLWRMLVTQATIYYIVSKARFSNIDFSLESITKYTDDFKVNYSGLLSLESNIEEEEILFETSKKYIVDNLMAFLDKR